MRAVLRRAAASSPAALAAALRRYRESPAPRAGCRRRRDARSTAPRSGASPGELEDQLVWWELMPAGDDPGELELDDLDRIDEVAARGHGRRGASRTAKLERLRSLLADGRPTLVFSSRRETVRYLRDRLGPPPLAWCTGTRAGLGALPDAAGHGARAGFARTRQSDRTPRVRHLLVTDVAAEGLDLQRAARVVHYDLPWTPMRLEQREGTGGAARLAASRRWRSSPSGLPRMERALRLTQALAAQGAAARRRPGLGRQAADSGAGDRSWPMRTPTGQAVDRRRRSCPRPAGRAGGVRALRGRSRAAEYRLASALVWIDAGRPVDRRGGGRRRRLARGDGTSRSACAGPGLALSDALT